MEYRAPKSKISRDGRDYGATREEMKSLGLHGSTGLVGDTLLRILDEQPALLGKTPQLQLAASPASIGQTRLVRGKKLAIQETTDSDVRIFCVPADIAQRSAASITESGAWVVDTSPAHRLDPDVLLCVPEVNGNALTKRLQDLKQGALLPPRSRMIASPSSTATLISFVVHALEKAARIHRVRATTFLSASHLGRAGIADFAAQGADAQRGREVVSRFASHPLWDQCLPQEGESKLAQEARKVLGRPTLPISLTAVRVPVTHGEAISLNVEFDRPLKVNEAREILQATAGIVVQDRPEKGLFPVFYASSRIPMEGARGRNAVFVGRIHHDDLTENALNLWVVSDNLRKGAAWNAIQIVETLLSQL